MDRPGVEPMAGLVMAGGRGARMAGSGGPPEKLLIEHGGRPVVLRVADALLGSSAVSSVHAATSPHAPAAADALRRAGIGIVPTAGAGYSLDLAEAVSVLARAGCAEAAMVVPGDLPLLTAAALRSMRAMYESAVSAAPAAPPPPAWACFVVPVGQAVPCVDPSGSPAGPPYLTPEGNAAYTGISVVNLRAAAGASASPGCGQEIRLPLEDPLVAVGYNTASDMDLVGRIGRLSRTGAGPPPE